MNHKNLLFILNPYDLLVSPTLHAGEIPEIIQRRANGVDLIVCCGGDGTLNETVTGLMQLDPRPPLGYLPAGTVNDFASSLGIPKDLEAAAQAVLSGSPVDVDIGRFGEQYFTYVAAFGAFTEVSYQTPQQSKNMFGRTAYVLEGLKCLTSLKSYPVSIEFDNGTCQGDYLFGMVSNASSVGGLKLLDDRISMNDGMFEVLLIQKPDSLIEMQQVINAVLLHDYSSPLITVFRTSNLTVSCENETPWTLDGEFGGAPQKIEIENLHLALRVIL